jgi:hypothetical protein
MWYDTPFAALGNDGYPIIAANQFLPEDLVAFEGYKLTSLSFFRTSSDAATTTPVFRWFVQQDGQRLFDAPVIDPVLGWNTIELETPLSIDVSKPLYYGVELVQHDAEDWPLGAGSFYLYTSSNQYIDMLYADGKGNLYSENGGKSWQVLSDYSDEYLYHLWCVRATLAKDPAAVRNLYRDLSSYEVYRNGQRLFSAIFASSIPALELNHFIDLDPLPGNDACYTVKSYYKIYRQYSNGKTACLTINGIDLVEETGGLKVYPNVINRNETIQLELPGNFNFQNAKANIYDLSGKLVKTQQINALQTSILIDLNAGVYLLKINDAETVKLIVKRIIE